MFYDVTLHTHGILIPFKMAATDMDVNTKTVSDKEDDERHTGAAEAPVEVKISRKRKNDVKEPMETDASAKKPNFPMLAVEDSVSFLHFCHPQHRG